MSWERHVKTSPNTENSDNTISSLARGEEVTIIGKTAYGYLIYKAEDIVTEIPSVVVHFGWSIGERASFHTSGTRVSNYPHFRIPFRRNVIVFTPEKSECFI